MESAALSSFPPPSARTEEPPSSRAKHLSLPYLWGDDCYDRATPRELKDELIRLFEITGLKKRPFVRACGRPWETGRGYLDPRALDRTPKPEFVRAAAELVRIVLSPRVRR